MSTSIASLFSHCRGSRVSPKYCAGAVWPHVCYLCPMHCLGESVGRQSPSALTRLVMMGKDWRGGRKPCPSSTSAPLAVFCTSNVISYINRLLNLPESIQGVLRSQRIEMLFWKAWVSSTHWKLADEILKILKFPEEQWETKDMGIIMLWYSVIIFNAVHSKSVCVDKYIFISLINSFSTYDSRNKFSSQQEYSGSHFWNTELMALIQRRLLQMKAQFW